MRNRLKLTSVSLLCLSLWSCSSHRYAIVKASRTEYPMDNRLQDDSAIIREFLPYKQKMDAQMNSVIGRCEQELAKGTEPETLLGNFFADAVLTESKKIDPQIDFAMPSTRGGLRSDLPKGDIHLFNVFELMPFENETVVLTLSGKDVQALLNSIAMAGGEPVSGIRMSIRGTQPEKVLINGKPLDTNQNYEVLTSDYVAGGGDHIGGLQNPLQKKVLGLKIRDALIAYIKDQTASAKTINAALDGRITKN